LATTPIDPLLVVSDANRNSERPAGWLAYYLRRRLIERA
jgi:hypothetical protein